MKLHTISVFLLSVASIIAAPRATLTPAEPKWGDRIELTYRADVSGAKLPTDQPAVALVTIWYSGRIEQRRLKMDASAGNPRASLIAPEGACFLVAYFVTREANDGSVSAIIRDAGGTPARGAWLQSMLSPLIQKDYRERAARELALYPDNWALYRDKWFVAGVYEPSEQKAMIAGDLATIERGAPDRPQAALYALSYGYLLLGREPEARAMVHQMVERFPNTLLTASAIASYEYQGYVQHLAEEKLKEVGDWAVETYRLYPDSQLARNDIDTYGLAQRLTPDIIEAICKSWIKDEPENPKPYMQLAEAYKKRRADTHAALDAAEKALDLLAAGEMRLHGDVYGKATEWYTSATYTTAAELALDLKQYAKAIAYARAAETTGKQTSPDAYAAEAKVWAALGRSAYEQAALKQAWEHGDESARGKVTDTAPNSAKRIPAPAFEFTTIDGRRVDSASLRGKVIVANFWFTGCGPCKAEIPDLNRLAAEFRGKDVVFLAFSTDEDPDLLRRFLKDNPFDYAVVPNAGKIASQFGVESYPSHAIVGKDGTLESFLMGAGEHRAEQLRTVITRLLE